MRPHTRITLFVVVISFLLSGFFCVHFFLEFLLCSAEQTMPAIPMSVGLDDEFAVDNVTMLR
jgi:hypothetical protein